MVISLYFSSSFRFDVYSHVTLGYNIYFLHFFKVILTLLTSSNYMGNKGYEINHMTTSHMFHVCIDVY